MRVPIRIFRATISTDVSSRDHVHLYRTLTPNPQASSTSPAGFGPFERCQMPGPDRGVSAQLLHLLFGDPDGSTAPGCGNLRPQINVSRHGPLLHFISTYICSGGAWAKRGSSGINIQICPLWPVILSHLATLTVPEHLKALRSPRKPPSCSLPHQCFALRNPRALLWPRPSGSSRHQRTRRRRFRHPFPLHKDKISLRRTTIAMAWLFLRCALSLRFASC